MCAWSVESTLLESMRVGKAHMGGKIRAPKRKEGTHD
jgi:hypothetical protein